MFKLIKLALILKEMGLEEESSSVEELSSIDWEKELGQENQKEFSLSDEETKYFGLSDEELSNLSEETILDYTKKEIGKFKFLGAGSFRKVFEIPGNNDFIIKIARNPEGSKMNKAEFLLQSSFEGYFPRIFKHGMNPMIGSEFDWMIVEKVKKLRDNDELDSFFPYIKMLVDNFGHQGSHDNNVQSFFYFYQKFKIGFLRREPYLRSMKKLIKMASSKEPLFKKLIEISEVTNMDFSDMKPDNLGKTNKGEFRIIDASIFEGLPSLNEEEVETLDDQVRFDLNF